MSSVPTPSGVPLVMGIVNVTPDSFSDGGRYLDPDRAVAHGLELLAEGRSLGNAAATLHISRRTADRRLAAARRALGVRTTTEALLLADGRGRPWGAS